MADRCGHSSSRATSPMIAKSLEAAVVVLFIGVVTTGLYAGVVPDYRSVTSAEVGDRTLAAAGHEIEQAVPPEGEAIETERRVELPTTIRSEPYRIVAVGGETDGVDDAGGVARVELRHPHPAVEGSRSLSLPAHVVEVRGELAGGDGWVIVSSAHDDGVVVTLRADRREGTR